MCRMKIQNDKKSIFEKIKKRKKYFELAADEIARRNIETMKNSSFICIIVSLLLFVVTPYVFPQWKVSAPYINLLLVMVAVCMFAWLVEHRLRLSNHSIMVLTMCYYLLICFLFFGIDIYANPRDIVIYIPFIISILPVIFTLPTSISCMLNILITVCYFIAVKSVKDPVFISEDMYRVAISVVFSLISSEIVMGIRISDNLDKFEYKYLSTVDRLTGLYNKTTSTILAKDYFKYRMKYEHSAIIILDIDNFKRINDQLGHEKGDYILATIGQVLQQNLRHNDIVGRFGGDEFLIVLPDLVDREALNVKCSLINSKVREVESGNSEVRISCSIGAFYTEENREAFEYYFKCADDALYEAKQFGRNTYVIHDDLNKKEGSKPIMIIADDSEMSRAFMKKGFSDEYEVIEAANGKEVLGLVSEYDKKIAIILLDVEMPEMDGYEVVKYLKSRAKFSNIPIIMISAEAENEKQALLLGADDMISKPVKPAIARIRVANLLRLKNIQ